MITLKTPLSSAKSVYVAGFTHGCEAVAADPPTLKLWQDKARYVTPLRPSEAKGAFSQRHVAAEDERRSSNKPRINNQHYHSQGMSKAMPTECRRARSPKNRLKPPRAKPERRGCHASALSRRNEMKPEGRFFGVRTQAHNFKG